MMPKSEYENGLNKTGLRDRLTNLFVCFRLCGRIGFIFESKVVFGFDGEYILSISV